jgi:hypothetical protein
MPKKKTTKKTAWKPKHGTACYVVVAVCNFDDVMLGCFMPTKDGLQEATFLAEAVALDPSIRLQARHQARDTDMLYSRIYKCNKGTKFIIVADYEMGDGERKAATR